MKRFNIFIAFLLSAVPVVAQEKLAAPASGNFYMNVLIVVFIIAAILLLGFAVVLLNTFKTLSNEIANPTPLPEKKPIVKMEYEQWAAIQNAKPSIFTKLLGLKPIEEEKDLLIDHEFDGIKELDNPVPGWFNILFYGSILVAIMYFVTYHVAGWGQLQDQEYVTEMKQAEVEKAAYLAKSANKIDENSVKEDKEASTITAGKSIFTANCVACHGDKAQGVVGPNLTDEFWLHGGKINNVFKTIKYGVPDKGMISWEKTLSPKQIAEVSNYIFSLKGSNPANPKAPQGNKES
jgi:cytochrome c oxidase cbb3-type subunit 3